MPNVCSTLLQIYNNLTNGPPHHVKALSSFFFKYAGLITIGCGEPCYQDKFNEAGVEILSPHYRAARDGNHIAIPNQYIPSDYKTPSFNIKNNDNLNS